MRSAAARISARSARDVKALAKRTATADTKRVNATHTLTAVIYPGDTGRWLVAYNPETGTTTQGRNLAEALKNLKEATALYLEEAPQPVRGRALLTTLDVTDA